MQRAMAALWERHGPTNDERVDLLERAALALLESDHLPADARSAAEAAAHKLAGSLGTFGLDEGTELARRAEAMLQDGSADAERLAAVVVRLRSLLCTSPAAVTAGASTPEPFDAAHDTRSTAVHDTVAPPDRGRVGRVVLAARRSVVRRSVGAELSAAGLDVTEVSEPGQLVALAEDAVPDLAIMVVEASDEPDHELFSVLRRQPGWSATVLVAMADAVHTVAVLDAGADDAFGPELASPELVARVLAHLRRRRRDLGERSSRHADTVASQSAGEARTASAAVSVPAVGADGVDVVIVDDDDMLVDLLTFALESRGWSWHRFDNGMDATAALGRREVTGSVVVLDVGLPGADGFTVLNVLRHQRVLDHSRVLMLTARSGTDETLEALELGASDHVAKPFSVPVLMERIERLLGGRR